MQQINHVLEAFERSPEHAAFRAWKESLQGLRSDLIDVNVIRVWPDETNPRWHFAVEASSANATKDEIDLTAAVSADSASILLFDNHGKGRSALKARSSDVGFYQEFGSDNLRFHHALGSPPPTGFGFNFFVLSLLEAAMIKVLIVDERIAEAVFDGEQGFNKSIMSRDDDPPLLKVLGSARCYPIFTVWTDRKHDHERLFISNALEESNTQMKLTHPDDMKMIHPDEGLDLRHQGSNGINVEIYDEHTSVVKQLEDIDFIIIHQGVIDKLDNSGHWNESDLDTLYNYSPSIVITSGRGRTLRHVLSETPFVEFATVRENTYAGLSKYHLVRACLSVVGTKEGD